MKKIVPFLTLVLTVIASCKKTSTTINNTIPAVVTKPSFIVNGVTDVTFTSYTSFYTSLNYSVEYLDSVQESVSLSLFGLPAGVTVDTNNMSGIPTYSITVSMMDTNARPGIYPITLLAATASGKQNTYSFNLTILPILSSFFGKYSDCSFPCGGTTTHYTDSIYVDPVIYNKIWFANFNNTGSSVYGYFGLDHILEPLLTIPPQTISGTIYSGSGNVYINPKHTQIMIQLNAGANSCYLNMR